MGDYHDKKFDQDKPMMNLLPFDALEEVAKILTYGAKKYSANSWRGVPDALDRYKAAMLRHLTAIQNGEENDIESGLSHTAHMACNALFICALSINKDVAK